MTKFSFFILSFAFFLGRGVSATAQIPFEIQAIQISNLSGGISVDPGQFSRPHLCLTHAQGLLLSNGHFTLEQCEGTSLKGQIIPKANSWDLLLEEKPWISLNRIASLENVWHFSVEMVLTFAGEAPSWQLWNAQKVQFQVVFPFYQPEAPKS